MKLFDLHGKVAVVTGGNNGKLGPIFVEALREAGASVFIIDLPDYDITRPNYVLRAIEDCKDIPDIIVNNAAIDNPPGTDSTFWGNYRKIIDVNLDGACRVIQGFLPHMVKRGSGVIVNIGSIQGEGGADWRNYEGDFQKPVAYNLSKAGLKHLSKCLTTQYGKYGIRSVTISFSAVESDKFKEPFRSRFLNCLPMRRFITEDDLKKTILYACCCEGLAGATVLCDGGYCSW